MFQTLEPLNPFAIKCEKNLIYSLYILEDVNVAIQIR